MRPWGPAITPSAHSLRDQVVQPSAKPVHNCAQVERDNLDLHHALGEALKRIHLANTSLDVHRAPPLRFRDLEAVFDRTSRPETQP